MPANYSGANISTRAGEGAADIMTWGNLDRSANQLYQEQKLREQRGYNDYLAGEQSLQKEFANVRSADVPDVVAAYNDRKRTRQQILFDEKIKNNPILLAQKQQELSIKDAQLRQLIAGSQELKDIDKGINQRKISHVDDFDSEKVKEHALDLNRPYLERIKMGRLDASPYLYQGTNTDFGKLSKSAQGSLQTLPFGPEAITPDKWNIEQKQIARYNNPVQYADNMYKALQQQRAGQDAARLLNTLSPSDISRIQTQFDDIPEKEFKDRWGIEKGELLNGVLPDDKAGQYVLLDAMKYATMNMPKEVASKFRDNDEYKRTAIYEDWAKKYGIAEADRRERQRRSFANQKELLGLQESQGNEFDRIGSVKPIETKQGSTIKGGLVYDKDGNPRTGEIVIAKEELPASIYSILKASNIEIKEPKLTMVTENGQIVGLISKKYGLIDRKTLENAQLNFNKEPQKGKQMQFGKPSPTNKPAKDPLGIFNK